MSFVNQFAFSSAFESSFLQEVSKPVANSFPVEELSLHIPNLIRASDLSLLDDELKSLDWEPVGQDGIQSHYHPSGPIGSFRASAYSQVVADLFWVAIKSTLPNPRHMQATTPTDWDNHACWRPIGVNPLLRFIRYLPGGLLVPHYDAPYDAGTTRTLMSLLVYIARSEKSVGGQTRFIADPQIRQPLATREYADWGRPAREDEIAYEAIASPGDALIFDHRLLHDSAPLVAGEKIVLRTDIVFERV